MNCPECGQFYDGKSCDHKKGTSTPKQEYPQGKRSDAAQELLEGPPKIVSAAEADTIFEEPVAVKRGNFTFTFSADSFKHGHFEKDHVPNEVARRKAFALYAIDAVENGEMKVNLRKSQEDGKVISGAVMFYKELPQEARQTKERRKCRYIVVFTDQITGRVTDIRTYYAPKKVPPKHAEQAEKNEPEAGEHPRVQSKSARVHPQTFGSASASKKPTKIPHHLVSGDLRLRGWSLSPFRNNSKS